MMDRKNFIRNTLMAFAVSLLPKTLLPTDYSYTETRVVSKYISSFAVFSRQLMKSLPFLQTTLPQILLKDFTQPEKI